MLPRARAVAVAVAVAEAEGPAVVVEEEEAAVGRRHREDSFSPARMASETETPKRSLTRASRSVISMP
ncbi:MAG: hypothetical protein AB7I38_17975 [Dehalococcoidia bacterium]